MSESNLNAFDDWADTSKIFVREEDPRRVADVYASWWKAANGKPLVARMRPDTPYDGQPSLKGTVAPAHGGFVTLIVEAALLSPDQVLHLAGEISRTLDTLVIAAPPATEGRTWGYAVYEAGKLAFGQDARDVGGEMVVTTRGEAWLASQNLAPQGGGAIPWVFENISQAVGLRVWELNPRDKHTYYSMDEQS
jgi:hypothetical protein